MSKQSMLKQIELVESKIMVYSDRDQNRVKELSIELKALNLAFLDCMMHESLCETFENFLDNKKAA